MNKIQTTLEFTIIVSFVIILAVGVSVVYFGYVNKGTQTQTITSPNYMQSFDALNSTSDIITSTQPLPNKFNMSFSFTISGINKNEIINYTITNKYTNQYGTQTYIINIIGNVIYNPFVNTNYTICNINYKNDSKMYSIIINNNC
jgi:predicted PurR-regulated permease PerM